MSLTRKTDEIFALSNVPKLSRSRPKEQRGTAKLIANSSRSTFSRILIPKHSVIRLPAGLSNPNESSKHGKQLRDASPFVLFSHRSKFKLLEAAGTFAVVPALTPGRGSLYQADP